MALTETSLLVYCKSVPVTTKMYTVLMSAILPQLSVEEIVKWETSPKELLR